MYECFHCGERAVIWDSDFDGEDFGYIDPGIVHVCHCSNCGAEITYFIPLNNEEETEETEDAETEETSNEQ